MSCLLFLISTASLNPVKFTEPEEETTRPVFVDDQFQVKVCKQDSTNKWCLYRLVIFDPVMIMISLFRPNPLFIYDINHVSVSGTFLTTFHPFK